MVLTPPTRTMHYRGRRGVATRPAGSIMLDGPDGACSAGLDEVSAADMCHGTTSAGTRRSRARHGPCRARHTDRDVQPRYAPTRYAAGSASAWATTRVATCGVPGSSE